jgi:hypothetical protein
LQPISCVFTWKILNFPPLNTEFDGMMRKLTHNHLLGLGFIFMALGFFAGGLKAQGGITKSLKDVTGTVTDPLNSTQQVTKDVVQPLKDVRTTTKTITNAPKEITREVDQTKKAFESVGNEVERTESDVKKLTGNGDNNKGNDKDTTATAKPEATAADGKAASDGKAQETGAKYVPPDYVPEKKATPAASTKASGVDPRDVPRPIPPGSRDNKTPSGPMADVPAPVNKEPDQGVAPAEDPNLGDNRSGNAAAGDKRIETTSSNEAGAESASASDATIVNTNPAASYTSVSIPPNTAGQASTDAAKVSNPSTSMTNEAASAGSASSSEQEAGRYVQLTPVAGEATKRPKPDYSLSPARIALEKAEFDIETLEQLFKYSNWEGLEREHTVRAVEYALNEMQVSIVEIKKLDPGFSTWRFEERYKEMRAAYQKAKQP